MTEMITVPYTLCFCIVDESVLMLYRNNFPNQYLWNGIGGKIETGESIMNSLYREILEESEIDLSLAKVVYTGVVCWNTADHTLKGMYCFLAYLSSSSFIFEDRMTREGLLSWKNLHWVLSKTNKQVVSNITQFLPLMLFDQKPSLYRCFYTEHVLKKMAVELLPKRFEV